MHYHCEIIMPPTDDVPGAVSAIMEKFNENNEEARSSAFWDFWVIGGRWAGEHQRASLDQEKLSEFNEWLIVEKVTVSGFTAGKQSLQPADQIPKVDAKWREMFGGDGPCILFKHSNDQYGQGTDGVIEGDICKLADAPLGMKCERVIIAIPGWKADSKPNPWTGPFEARFMLSADVWNGCNHMPVAWDGTISGALADYQKDLASASAALLAVALPQPDWLVVTVDYHS
jgi:hypothetical protein